MNEETEKGEDVRTEPANSELKPAKNKLKKTLFTGCKIVVGTAGILVVLGMLAKSLTRTRGVPHSARLRFEQRQAEIDKQINQSEQADLSAGDESDSAR